MNDTDRLREALEKIAEATPPALRAITANITPSTIS